MYLRSSDADADGEGEGEGDEALGNGRWRAKLNGSTGFWGIMVELRVLRWLWWRRDWTDRFRE